MIHRNNLIRYLSICFFVMQSSCGARKLTGDGNKDMGNANYNANPSFSSPTIDGRSAEEVLCSEAPKVIANAKKDDFSELFSLVCSNPKEISTAVKESIQKTYLGSGEPYLNLLRYKFDSEYNTDLIWISSIKVPLADPSLFGDLKPHDIFAKGIAPGNSLLKINVVNREAFPGKRSVEKVILNYDLTNAEGAGIFDQRKTEFNTFIVVENNRDLVVSTAHLLDAANNVNYHLARGLTLGIKSEGGYSYLIFVNQLVMKNRIDPERMKQTLINLNKEVAKLLHKHVTEKTLR